MIYSEPEESTVYLEPSFKATTIEPNAIDALSSTNDISCLEPDGSTLDNLMRLFSEAKLSKSAVTIRFSFPGD